MLLAGAALAGAASFVAAADASFFRIGTGGKGGLYFPLGRAVADLISGEARCLAAGRCVEGLVAVAQMSNGSVANVRAISDGRLEAGFAQADIVHAAYTADGPFAGEPALADLRVIANLYPEAVHLVARRDGRIATVRDLAGKRVSLDEPGSGTLVDARLVLAAHGLTEDDIDPFYMKPELAAEEVAKGRLDAFFIVAGHPVPAVAEAAHDGLVTVIPIAGPPAERLLRDNPFFTPVTIPDGTYAGTGELRTLAVGAMLVTSGRMPQDLIYRVTAALWHEENLAAIRARHPRGRDIVFEKAVAGVPIPIHDGALRYYRERGLVQ